MYKSVLLWLMNTMSEIFPIADQVCRTSTKYPAPGFNESSELQSITFALSELINGNKKAVLSRYQWWKEQL